jgi:hypothetical protein
MLDSSSFLRLKKSTMTLTVSEKFSLDLSFKGDRTYLRGADIFTECMKRIPCYDAFSMLFRRKMVGSISVEPFVGSIDEGAHFSGSIRCVVHGETYNFGLLEDASNPVTHRVSYDESAVIAGCEMDVPQTRIVFVYTDCAGGASFMDYVVALNKALLNRCVSNDVKWAFSKLELMAYPRFGTIKLQLKNQIGLRLVKSAIYVDDILFGHIYFSDFSSQK